MEIFIVVLLLLVIAAVVFAWVRFRPGPPAQTGGLPGNARGFDSRRGAASAAHHDPMAQAVERHSMATDPREAAEAELQLQAQANRVASDLHARQASALQSEVDGVGRFGHTSPANDYGQPGANGYGQPDANAYGQPGADGYAQPGTNGYGQPVSPYDGPPPADTRPVFEDEDGRPVYEDGTPAYGDGTSPRY